MAIRLKLKGAISRSGPRLHAPQGRQSLSHHSSRVRTAACSTRWATIHQIPIPAYQKVMPEFGFTPASDEAKVTFDNSAKRNCLTQIVF